MNTETEVLLGSIELQLETTLGIEQRLGARAMLNTFHLGDVQDTHLIDGVLVPKHQERQTPEYHLAQRRLDSPVIVKLRLGVTPSGALVLEHAELQQP